MAGLVDADQGRRQHRPHRTGIDPAIGMPAHHTIDRTMVHAGAAADAAQHVLEFGADDGAAAVVEKDDMVLGRPVGIIGPARAGGQRGVGREFLAGGRARQKPQQGREVLERRHQLLQARHHDMRLGEALRQIAVALIGDDDGRAGLGDAEIGAGDADLGGEESFPQHGARFRHQGRGFPQRARRVEVLMRLAEAVGDLLLHEMHGRHDDVARTLLADLDDVFAEIGLDRRHAVLLEIVVEGDLLADHGLALGHRLGVKAPADRQHRLARLLRRAAPMHLPAARDDVLLEDLEIEIEIRQHVILDRLALLAQRVEFRQARHHGGALGGKAGAHHAERLLQIGVAKRPLRVFLEGAAGRLHQERSAAAPMGGVSPAMPASTSAT